MISGILTSHNDGSKTTKGKKILNSVLFNYANVRKIHFLAIVG
jgi:hypothetical protein